MADLDDLEYVSISDMSPDEAIEHLRQLRLSRRIPVKRPAKKTSTKATKSRKAPDVSAEQAADLLKILTGG